LDCFSRGQVRRANIDFLPQRLAVELDQNLAGVSMRAVRDVDRAHDPALSDPERHRYALRLGFGRRPRLP
jgi:hypothetical protein